MSSIAKSRKCRKSRHNPEIERMKRVTRNLRIDWREVCEKRDALRRLEIEQRAGDDAAREAGWRAFVILNGWSLSQLSWWRNGFQRVYGRRIAKGCDYLIVPKHDLIADSVRESNPEFREWETDDIWELLLSDYPPLLPIEQHYHNAVAALTAALLTTDVPF